MFWVAFVVMPQFSSSTKGRPAGLDPSRRRWKLLRLASAKPATPAESYRQPVPDGFRFLLIYVFHDASALRGPAVKTARFSDSPTRAVASDLSRANAW